MGLNLLEPLYKLVKTSAYQWREGREEGQGARVRSSKVPGTVSKINKIQGYSVNQRNIVNVTIKGVKPLKIVNHHVVLL